MLAWSVRRRALHLLLAPPFVPPTGPSVISSEIKEELEWVSGRGGGGGGGGGPGEVAGEMLLGWSNIRISINVFFV